MQWTTLKWPWAGRPDRVFEDFADLGNPYHNADHTVGIVTRLRKIASRLIEPLSAEEKEDLDIAGLYHDAGHAGITVRSQSPRNLPRKDLSNEEYAVLLMRHDIGRNLSSERLDRIAGLIMATTFGQVPHPHPPTTPMEKIIAYADVGNVTCTFDDWMTDNFNVLREMPEANRPADFESFRASRLGFLKYVGTKLDDVVPLVNLNYGHFLRERLADIERMVNDVRFNEYEPDFEAIISQSR